MRTCAKCLTVIPTVGLRYLHQNSCSSPLNVEFAEQQQQHEKRWHRT